MKKSNSIQQNAKVQGNVIIAVMVAVLVAVVFITKDL